LLQIYEPSEEFLAAPDAVLPAETQLYSVEEDESVDDGPFAFAALLQDLLCLREEVNDLWEAYGDGKIDLATAATAANTAVELARAFEEDIEPLLKRNGGALDILNEFFHAACETAGLDPSQRARPTDDMNLACYEMGSAFFHNAAVLLISVLGEASFDSKTIPTYSGIFGYYDPQLDGSQNDRERWAQDKAAVLELVPDITLIADIRGIVVADELGRGIRQMFRTRKVPLWLCFAMQSYLDTLHIFGPNIARAFDELNSFNEKVDVTMQSEMDLSTQSAMTQDLRDIQKALQIKKYGVDVFAAIRTVAPGGGEPRTSRFFQHHPLFCGLMKHHVRVLLHRLGVTYAAGPGEALHCVQLYKAVQEHQRDQGSSEIMQWPKLDELIAMQGPQAFFVGTEPPGSVEAHFKNYCLTRQISPTNWLPTANRHKGKKGAVPVKQSSAGVRILNLMAPLSMRCASRTATRYTDGITRAPWDAEFLQELLQKRGRVGQQTDENMKPRPEQDSRGVHAAADSPQASQDEKSSSYPGVLVRSLAEAVQAEIPALAFNYVKVQAMSAELLFRLMDYAPTILSASELSLCKPVDVVGAILAVAAGVRPYPGDKKVLLDHVLVEMRQVVDSYELAAKSEASLRVH
jgi:hypothetical protein